MKFITEGEAARFLYEAPRTGLGDLGIAPVTVLFVGKKTGNNTYQGEARTFSAQCGAFQFPVAGEATANGTRVVLQGQAPRHDSRCQLSGYRNETLAFELKRY